MTRLPAYLALIWVIGCSSPPRNTTPAFAEHPVDSIAVLPSTSALELRAAAETLTGLWRTHLAERGWELASPEQASAILHSSVDRWEFVSGGRYARVAVRARLLRSSDGALLWKDHGLGTEESSREEEDEDDESLLESATRWAAESAVQSLSGALGLGDREQRLNEAANDAVSDALFSLPGPSEE